MERLYNVRAKHPDYPPMASAKPLPIQKAKIWARRAILINGAHWVEISPTWTINGPSDVIHSSRRADHILKEARRKGEEILHV